MVRVSLLFTFWAALIGPAAHAAAAPDTGSRFTIEFSKPEIWEGEQVYCHFVLYAEDDALEVEVAKFPEFRGFWSENLALRQGPIPLLRESGFGAIRRAVVGTYLITPMVGRNDYRIEPMKLVVRRILGGANEPAITFLSTVPKLPIKKLPGGAPDNFRGAVGSLFLQPESGSVRFRKDEPTAIRMLLQGEGNFQEVNEIPIDFPPFVEVVSKRATLMGSGQFASKTFEVTVTPHTDVDFDLPPVKFTAFNPLSGRYETRPMDSIRFLHETKPELPPAPQEFDPERLKAPERHWSRHRSVGQHPFFWLLQLLLAAAFATIVGRELRRRARVRYLASLAYHRRQQWEKAQSAWGEKETEGFLRLADELAYEILRDRTGVRGKPISRVEILRVAERKKIPATVIAAAERLFEAHERFSYSGSNTMPPEDLITNLEQVVAVK